MNRIPVPGLDGKAAAPGLYGTNSRTTATG